MQTRPGSHLLKKAIESVLFLLSETARLLSCNTTSLHTSIGLEKTENLWQQLSLENPVYGLHPLPALGLRLRAELVGALRRVQDKAATELPAQNS